MVLRLGSVVRVGICVGNHGGQVVGVSGGYLLCKMKGRSRIEVLPGDGG
jgi:hypothetical protein